jgi:hypothetical protein
MKAQSAAAAATSGVVRTRVPHMPSGADVSSSAAASEALIDTSSIAGRRDGAAVTTGRTHLACPTRSLQKGCQAPLAGCCSSLTLP